MIHGVHAQGLLGLERHVAEGAEVVAALVVLDKVGPEPLFGVARVVAVGAVHVLHSCRAATRDLTIHGFQSKQ